MLGKLGLVWGPTNVGLNVFLDKKFKTFLGRSAPVGGVTVFPTIPGP